MFSNCTPIFFHSNQTLNKKIGKLIIIPFVVSHIPQAPDRCSLVAAPVVRPGEWELHGGGVSSLGGHDLQRPAAWQVAQVRAERVELQGAGHLVQDLPWRVVVRAAQKLEAVHALTYIEQQK